jgi:hypothetical protein
LFRNHVEDHGTKTGIVIPTPREKEQKPKTLPGYHTTPSRNKEGRETDKEGRTSNPGYPSQDEAGCLKKKKRNGQCSRG